MSKNLFRGVKIWFFFNFRYNIFDLAKEIENISRHFRGYKCLTLFTQPQDLLSLFANIFDVFFNSDTGNAYLGRSRLVRSSYTYLNRSLPRQNLEKSELSSVKFGNLRYLCRHRLKQKITFVCSICSVVASETDINRTPEVRIFRCIFDELMASHFSVLKQFR